jgi:hypothetical protein
MRVFCRVKPEFETDDNRLLKSNNKNKNIEY